MVSHVRAGCRGAVPAPEDIIHHDIQGGETPPLHL